MRRFHIRHRDDDTYELKSANDLLVVRTHKGKDLGRLDFGKYNFLKSHLNPVAHFPESDVTVFKIWGRDKYTTTEVQEISRQQLSAHPDIVFSGRGLKLGDSRIFQVYTENLFVKFHDDVPEHECRQLCRKWGLDEKLKVGFCENGYFLQPSAVTGQKVFTLAEELLDLSQVACCHPEIVTKRKSLSRDFEYFYRNSQISASWAHDQVNLKTAWQYSKGEGVKICIIDDGLETAHRAFAGKIHKELDMLSETRKLDASHKFSSEMHGTACASVASADDTVLQGVAPASSLIPIRSKGLGSVLEAEAFYKAVQFGADIISCSWGPPDGEIDDPTDNEVVFPIPDHTSLAIEYAASKGRQGKGCLIFFAAGNGKEPIRYDGYASHPDVMAIGATEKNKRLTSYSDYGSPIFCIYPGGDVSIDKSSGVAVADREGYEGLSSGNYYNLFQGTSASAPGMAGIAALLLSLRPNLTRDEARLLLGQACKNPQTGQQQPYDQARLGHGLIDAATMISLIQETSQTQIMTVTKNRFALHMGVNDIDYNVYGNSYLPLNGCVADATAYARLTEGYEVRHILYDAQVTRARVLGLFKEFTEKAKSGDKVFITYAGHGGLIRDMEGDEKDKMDETLVLYDGLLIDDELRELFYQFKEGVDVVWVSDSCHSGTNTRGKSLGPGASVIDPMNSKGRRARQMSSRLTQAVYDRSQNSYANAMSKLETAGIKEDEIEYKANIVTIGACQDKQFAMEINGQGVFTAEFIQTINANPDVTIENLFSEIKQGLSGEEQVPLLSDFGPDRKRLLRSKILSGAQSMSNNNGWAGDNAPKSKKVQIEGPIHFTGNLIFGDDTSRDGYYRKHMAAASGRGTLRSSGFNGSTEWDKAYDAFFRQDPDHTTVVEPDVISAIYQESDTRSGTKFLHTYPNPEEEDKQQEYPFIWHLNDEHTGLHSACRSVCPELEDPTRDMSDKAYPTIAIIDTGIIDGHPTQPNGLDKAASRNFEDPEDKDHWYLKNGLLEQQGHGQATMALLAGGEVGYEDTAGEYKGYFGAFPLARVVALRISDRVAIFSAKKFSRAIEYAVKVIKADVISMSMAGVPSKAMAEAVNLAYENGVVLVSAGGNSWSKGAMKVVPDTLMYPARFDRVIAVTGATLEKTPYRNEYNDSNLRNEGSPYMGTCYGPSSAMQTAIAAYTPNISWASKTNPFFIRTGGGTSSATPQVAAAAALYLHKHRMLIDKLSKNEKWKKAEIIRQALFTSTEKPKDKKFEEYFGNGLLKATKAIKVLPDELEIIKAPEADLGKSNLDNIVDMWLRGSDKGPKIKGQLKDMVASEIEQLIMTSGDLVKYAGTTEVSEKLIKKIIKNDKASNFLKRILSIKLKRSSARKMRSTGMGLMKLDLLEKDSMHGVGIVANIDYDKRKHKISDVEKEEGCLGRYTIQNMHSMHREGGVVEIRVPDTKKMFTLVEMKDDDGNSYVEWLIEDPNARRSARSNQLSRVRYENGTYVYSFGGEAGSRGFKSFWKKAKTLVVSVFRTIRDKSIADVDGMVKLSFGDGGFTVGELTSKPAKTKRSLLLLHGTFASVSTSFKDLLANSDFTDWAQQRYGKNIIGYNMSTLRTGVEENAQDLEYYLEELGYSHSELDVIATSRGCLVARMVFDPSVTKMVLSAGTHLGTPIASLDNVKKYIDRATEMAIAKFGAIAPILPAILKGLSWFVSGVTNLRGITDQRVDSAIVELLQDPGKALTDKQLLIGNNSDPEDLKKYINIAIDFIVFSGKDNDGVTPTLSALNSTEYRMQRQWATHLIGDKSIGHFSYFQDEATIEKVINFL